MSKTYRPYRIIEWQDKEATNAKGWLVMDCLINGICGGGLFMHPNVSLEEVADLAHTMTLKNTLQSPQFGGGKGGIRFDPSDPRAKEVLRRFLESNEIYLKKFWCTGADLNTDNRTITEIIQKDLGLPSPFYSLSKMLEERFGIENHILEMNERLETPLNKYFRIEESATGYSMSCCLQLSQIREPKVIIQGFGAVGSSFAHFIQENKIGKVVGIADQSGFISNRNGIDIHALLEERKIQLNNGIIPIFKNYLTKDQKECYYFNSRSSSKSDEDYLVEFLSVVEGDIFSPCAGRYQITPKVLGTLCEKTLAQSIERTIISGANNSFRDGTTFHLLKHLNIKMLPEWVSNCGNALLFLEALKTDYYGKEWVDSVLKIIHQRITEALWNAMEHCHRDLGKIYESFYFLAEQKVRFSKSQKPTLDSHENNYNEEITPNYTESIAR
ncbi:MAG: hypothetical protein H7A32_00155 [Deltaproteobacteria bacterium]|nr:hypothetical protein [Deltaproteobacteria bacterium]